VERVKGWNTSAIQPKCFDDFQSCNRNVQVKPNKNMPRTPSDR
jgi:hypothetical protein